MIAYIDKLKGAEFIEFIRKRVVFLRELLSDKGSFYFHIDYKIGHYVKILLDEIFGQENFKNDITRIKCNPKNFKRKGYGNLKDMILFYTKTSDFIWNEPMVPFTQQELERLYKKKDIN
jgi:adenine-specific DNA-methyltransferase